MATNSKIEWTDHTFNAWEGCTKVAAGCANCYAETRANRYGKVTWGPRGTRMLRAEKYWGDPLKWNQEAQREGVRRRVFCASLADVFEEWAGRVVDHRGVASTLTLDDVRSRLFAMIDATPHLDWLLCTKRPENIRRMWIGCHANAWLLTSVATQEDADQNVPELLKCRDLTPVLGLSCEPLLGAVDLGLGDWVRLPGMVRGDFPFHATFAPPGVYRGAFNRHRAASVVATDGKLLGVMPDEYDSLGIDWVIAGGESGPGARPMHPDWARSLRDQCAAAGVSFFFKQWGEYAPDELLDDATFHRYRNRYTDGSCSADLMRYFNANGELLPAGDGCCEEGSQAMVRVGKKAAGRLLDGVTHDGFPTPSGSAAQPHGR